MSISNKLLKWYSVWYVSDNIVICRVCHAEQTMAEKNTAFEHSRGCGHSRYESYPWSDLERIREGGEK